MKQYDAMNIRSFVLAGHSGAGKTSVAEAIAYITGRNTRLGSVTDGSSLMDHEPEEKERNASLTSSFLTCENADFKYHIADTPGDGDFVHDAYLPIQAMDGVLLVVSAVDGVETQTEKMNAVAAELGVPRAVFINKLDRERANHEPLLAEIKEVLGVAPALIQLPIGKEGGFSGLVDLINRKAFSYSGDGGRPTEIPMPADMEDEIEAAIEALTDTVAMTDDELVEKYLEEGTLSAAEVRAGLTKGIAAGTMAPVMLGSATKNIGVDRILGVVKNFPSPVGRRPFKGSNADSPDEIVDVACAEADSFRALCFKTMIDPYVGHLSVFRVVSGSGGTDLHPTNVREDKTERFGTIFFLAGKKTEPVDRVVPGDIFAVPKLKHTQTGDTLVEGSAVQFQWTSPPAPMISYVIRPKTRADEDKVRGALEKTLAEDQGLKQTFDAVTHEIVLAGRGANHIAITVQKMARKYGANVEFGTPTIPYLETISGSADVRYRHKKQTGGAGQFGEVAIRVSPNDRGAGFVFENKTVGGVIPHSLIPSVEKGVRSQLSEGVLAGFPLVDVKVELYDGKSHPVDSKDIAFQTAGRMAIRRAVPDARPVLLEPVNHVEVTVPEDNVGDIMGDMNTRRAHIQSMEGRGRNSVVTATVPLAEMLTYAPALKSMTGGKGTYTMAFHAYEPVPSSMQSKLVADVSRIKDTDEE